MARLLPNQMRDPALGKSKAERSLGEFAPSTQKLKKGKLNKPLAPKKAKRGK